MSGYLWGIAQLVNDPSSELINALQKRIFGKSSQNLPNSESQPKKNNVCMPKSSTIRIKESTEIKTKCIQVGEAPVAHRHVGIQIKQHENERMNRTTSIQIISKPKRTTGTLHTTNIKDSCTKPIKKRICDDHRDVFKKLHNWSCRKEYCDEADVYSFKSIKNKIKKFANLMKIEKLQFPELYGPEEQFMKLYQRASEKK